MQPSVRRSDETIRGWLTNHAHTGGLLRFRRLSNGWSRLDVAQADGTWEWRDVHAVETMRQAPAGDVSRYLAALAKLEAAR